MRVCARCVCCVRASTRTRSCISIIMFTIDYAFEIVVFSAFSTVCQRIYVCVRVCVSVCEHAYVCKQAH